MSRFEIKIVAALLLIAVMPLVASVVLVGQVTRVSDSVSTGQLRHLARPLDRAAEAYRALVKARRLNFMLERELLVRDAALGAALASGDKQALRSRLRQLLDARPQLERLAIIGADRQHLASVARAPLSRERFRPVELDGALGSGARLSLRFATSRQPQLDLVALGRARRQALEISDIRDELASYYRVAFLIIFGAVLIASTAGGIFIARQTTRRLTVLARATRDVAEGDLETQVKIRGRDEVGELASAFNVMVGQLRESRERIGYLEKIGAWQEIARRLAHEIKNPLTPIQLAVQQLHQKYDGQDPKFRRMLDDARDIITEEVEGLRRLVAAFSSFARLPSVQPEPVDINLLVDDFFKSHVELLERAEIVWAAAGGPADVMGDRMLLKHVLFNLVENAVQAAEEAGQVERVEVRLAVKHDALRGRLELSVADNGPGMDPTTAARVFDPYFTTKEQGTGLGLAIVKKIVLEHGGAISVSSRAGAGSTFTLSLPLVDAPMRHESAILTTLSRLFGRPKEPTAPPSPPPRDGDSEEK